MSYPTAVNSQSTDTLTQTTLSAVSGAGAVANTVVNHSFAQTMSSAMQGAILQQQATQTLADAALTASLRGIASGSPASARKPFQDGSPAKKSSGGKNGS